MSSSLSSDKRLYPPSPPFPIFHSLCCCCWHPILIFFNLLKLWFEYSSHFPAFRSSTSIIKLLFMWSISRVTTGGHLDYLPQNADVLIDCAMFSEGAFDSADLMNVAGQRRLDIVKLSLGITEGQHCRCCCAGSGDSWVWGSDLTGRSDGGYIGRLGGCNKKNNSGKGSSVSI